MYYRIRSQFNDGIAVPSMGLDENSPEQHWGPGMRDVYILHYVLEGKGYFNGMPVSKGQGFFIERDTLIEYHADKSTPWTYFWFTIKCNKKLLENCFARSELILKNHVFDFSFLSELKELINVLNLNNRTELTAATALAVFYSVLSFHESQSFPRKSFAIWETYIQNAIQYIESNYHLPIRVTDIANYIHVDDRYLYNLFKEKRGISPKTYLNTLRIDRSCYLLKNTSLSVTSVGQSVGYSDSLAFSTFFKKHTGLSPKQYRQKMEE